MVRIGTRGTFFSYEITGNILPEIQIIIKFIALQKIPKVRGYVTARINYICMSWNQAP